MTYHAGFKLVKQKCSQRYNTSSADEHIQAADFRRKHPGLIGESFENVFSKTTSIVNASVEVLGGESTANASVEYLDDEESVKEPAIVNKSINEVVSASIVGEKSVVVSKGTTSKPTKTSNDAMVNNSGDIDETVLASNKQTVCSNASHHRHSQLICHPSSHSLNQQMRNSRSRSKSVQSLRPSPSSRNKNTSGERSSRHSRSSESNPSRSRSRESKNSSGRRSSRHSQSSESNRSRSRSRESKNSSGQRFSRHSQSRSRSRESRNSSGQRSSRHSESSDNRSSSFRWRHSPLRLNSGNLSRSVNQQPSTNLRSQSKSDRESHSDQRRHSGPGSSSFQSYFRSKPDHSSRISHQHQSGNSCISRGRYSHRRSNSTGRRFNHSRHSDAVQSISKQSSSQQIHSRRHAKISSNGKSNRKQLINEKAQRCQNRKDFRSNEHIVAGRRNKAVVSNGRQSQTTARNSPSASTSPNASVEQLIASVNELTEVVKRSTDKLAQNDRRLNRLEVTINKIFIMVGDMNGNNRIQEENDPDIDFPELPIVSEDELYFVHRQLKDNEFRKLWVKF